MVTQIIVSVAEHHSVIVPMQMLAQRTGATLRHVGLTPDQRVDAEVRFTLMLWTFILKSTVSIMDEGEAVN